MHSPCHPWPNASAFLYLGRHSPTRLPRGNWPDAQALLYLARHVGLIVPVQTHPPCCPWPDASTLTHTSRRVRLVLPGQMHPPRQPGLTRPPRQNGPMRLPHQTSLSCLSCCPWPGVLALLYPAQCVHIVIPTKERLHCRTQPNTPHYSSSVK